MQFKTVKLATRVVCFSEIFKTYMLFNAQEILVGLGNKGRGSRAIIYCQITLELDL